MQHQYDQQQRRQQVQQQQQTLVQHWLQSKHALQQRRQTCPSSPGSFSSSPGKWQTGISSPSHHVVGDWHWQQQLADGAACQQQSPAHHGPSSTAIRVSTTGGRAMLASPNMRMPLDGGCVDVYKDGVEVRSTNALVISVCSSPTQPPAAPAMTEHVSAGQLARGDCWLAGRACDAATPGQSRNAAKRLSL
jgi:hypothetical protein